MTAPLRNYDIAELRRLDVAHHLPAQQDYALMQELGGARIIVRGQGSTIWDGEGVALLDGMAGLWCVQVGYGRERLAEAAARQMREIPFYNTFFKTATPPPVLLATKISELLGGHFSHIFFNSSGSEAIDSFIRIARYYWQAVGQPQRTVIIARKNGYHGSTIGGASLGGMAYMHAQGGPWVPDIVHVAQPYGFEAMHPGESEDAFAERMAGEVEAAILGAGPERVAAFIGEPVQGAGGVIIPPEGYWPRVAAICRKYGILLACDEVICGFGRLGQWFGHQHYGITPDLVTMAKGLSSGYLPVSAVGVADFIVEAMRGQHTDFTHGYTYSGHPVSCAVALENIAIIEEEGLVERTREVTGPHLARRLAQLAEHPLVGEARSLGLIGAVEIVADKASRRRFGAGGSGVVVRDLCIANGLMVRAVRDSIVMSPPLVITVSEIDRMVDTIWNALAEARPVLEAL